MTRPKTRHEVDMQFAAMVMFSRRAWIASAVFATFKILDFDYFFSVVR